jgi:hypothetical protein
MPSDSAPQTAGALPLFHKNIIPLDAAAHARLRLDRGAGYGFSAAADYVPLGLEEIEPAGLFYPILFTSGEQPIPVALLGVRNGQNLFVDHAGAWMPQAYIPAYVRAFPFLFVEDAAKGARYVAVEADAACLSEERGLPLFQDDQPTLTLTEAVSLSENLRLSLRHAADLGTALRDAGVLEHRDATINFTAGETARIGGFMTIDRQKLDAVPDQVFLTWRQRGWLPAIYAHMASAGNWQAIIDLAANRPLMVQ